MKRKNYEMPSVEEVLVLVEQGFAASQVEKPDDDTNLSLIHISEPTRP